MSQGSRNIRVKERDRQIIQELMSVDEVYEMLVEEGIINEEKGNVSYEDMLFLITDGQSEFVRREEDMCWIAARDAHDHVTDLAGENVSVHDVITNIVDDFVEENGFEEQIEINE